MRVNATKHRKSGVRVCRKKEGICVVMGEYLASFDGLDVYFMSRLWSLSEMMSINSSSRCQYAPAGVRGVKHEDTTVEGFYFGTSAEALKWNF